MPALAAIRFNVDLKAKYQSLIAAGKIPKVAITAVIRKLIVLANALLKDQRKWTRNQLGQNGYSSDNPVRQQESRPRASSPRRSTFLKVFCDHVLYRIGTSPILHTRAAIVRAQAVIWCVGYLLNDRKTRR
jgi:hypothetical protein